MQKPGPHGPYTPFTLIHFPWSEVIINNSIITSEIPMLPLNSYTSSNTLMLPLELAETTMFDLPLQQTLETNSELSELVSRPVIGSIDPNL